MTVALVFASARLLRYEDASLPLSRHVAPITAFFYANVILAVSSLAPIPPLAKRGIPAGLGTDGWQLVSIPFRGRAWLSTVVAAHAAWEVERLMAAGDVATANARVDAALAASPSSLAAQLAQANLLLTAERWAEAAGRLRTLSGAAGRDASALRPIVVNNLAWADFMLDEPASLDEADRTSREALALAPRNPSVHGTRGAVLLARGDLEGAKEHLTFAFTRNGTANAKALNACCLSTLHAKRGDVEAARAWLAEARRLDAMSPLIARAAATLAATAQRVAGGPPTTGLVALERPGAAR